MLGRRLFLGANTPEGFYSFYGHLVGRGNGKTYILKGGPGAGKSSFMKRIVADLATKGGEIELFHCSADFESLDGVHFPAVGVTIVDGTAPHVVDPVYPGAFESIINLGEYWDARAIRKNKETIMALTKEISRLYRKAYGFLRSARSHYDEYTSYYLDTGAVERRELRKAINRLSEMYLPKRSISPPTTERHFFATALSPSGPINLLPSVTQKCRHVVVVQSEPGTGAEYVVDGLFRHAQVLGYPAEAFHCVLRPWQVEHFLVPELSFAVVTSRGAHTALEPLAWSEDLNSLVDTGRLKPFLQEMDHVYEQSKQALLCATVFLARAKAMHAELETYYVPHMDFARVDARRGRLLRELEELAFLAETANGGGRKKV